jgi:glycolate oxidase FAD binding subunit
MPPWEAAGAIEVPADEPALAARIAAAASFRRAARGLGQPHEGEAWAAGAGCPPPISTRALVGITLYSPAELVISARAGTPVAEIEAALAAKGQHLVAEPP